MDLLDWTCCHCYCNGACRYVLYLNGYLIILLQKECYKLSSLLYCGEGVAPRWYVLFYSSFFALYKWQYSYILMLLTQYYAALRSKRCARKSSAIVMQQWINFTSVRNSASMYLKAELSRGVNNDFWSGAPFAPNFKSVFIAIALGWDRRAIDGEDVASTR